MLGVIKARRVNAASQQTLFIVSGSQFIKCLREVTQMLCLGAVVLRLELLRSKLFLLSPAPHPSYVKAM